MKKTIPMLLLAILLSLAIATPALAVKFGEPDNGEHPYVGLIVFYDNNMVPQWRCSGTLISPTVMVTAAHCTELNGPAQVWFDEHVLLSAGYPYSGGVTGTAHAYPLWRGGLYLPNTGDAGVVVLDTPVNLGFYPTIASDGYLDKLATRRGLQDVNFEVVGYGLQSVKPVYSSLRDRMKAWVQLVNLRSALTDGYNIQTTNDPGKGTGPGGTCFGDSGGPIFTADHKIVAVNSFVMNENCDGSSFAYRLDKAEVQDWINSFMP
ncbi:MAG: trypsin-like serine protease [Anaerolineales bacterium]